MSAAHRFSAQQQIEIIDKDIRSRLIAMVSKTLDMASLARAIPDEAPQERIRWSLNWSRLVLGRLFLDLLGIRAQLRERQGAVTRPMGRADVSVNDLGGEFVPDFTEEEWECLDKFMTHADKVVHFAAHDNPPSEQEIDRAILIIVQALRTSLYDKSGRPFPLSKEAIDQLGLG